MSAAGDLRVELTLDDRPSGLGWMPDGTLIIVGMDGRTLYRWARGMSRAEPLVDLSPLCSDVAGHLNDLVVDDAGNIYVGFDPDFVAHGFRSEFGAIIHVDPQGEAAVAATGLHFPNGVVVADGGRRLIVAETGTPRLTCFDIGQDGALTNRSVWASVTPPRDPAVSWGDTGLDGCAIDGEGCVWVANSGSSDCLRVEPGGAIVDIVRLPPTYRCLACALGGADGRTLMVCGLELAASMDLADSVSHLFIATVPVGVAAAS